MEMSSTTSAPAVSCPSDSTFSDDTLALHRFCFVWSLSILIHPSALYETLLAWYPSHTLALSSAWHFWKPGSNRVRYTRSSVDVGIFHQSMLFTMCWLSSEKATSAEDICSFEVQPNASMLLLVAVRSALVCDANIKLASLQLLRHYPICVLACTSCWKLICVSQGLVKA